MSATISPEARRLCRALRESMGGSDHGDVEDDACSWCEMLGRALDAARAEGAERHCPCIYDGDEQTHICFRHLKQMEEIAAQGRAEGTNQVQDEMQAALSDVLKGSPLPTIALVRAEERQRAARIVRAEPHRWMEANDYPRSGADALERVARAIEAPDANQ